MSRFQDFWQALYIANVLSMITHLNKERQNDDIGSIETKELHKGVNESRHPQHLFYFHTRGQKT